jgi:uncharacterized membrane protein (UPF0127 family)
VVLTHLSGGVSEGPEVHDSAAMRRLYSLKDERGGVVCARCAMADSPLSRLRGLFGREELAPDEGLLLTPESSIHTLFMRFPIDVVFLDRELVVRKVASDVKPWRLVFGRRTRSVLELATGEAVGRGVEVGQRLVSRD